MVAHYVNKTICRFKFFRDEFLLLLFSIFDVCLLVCLFVSLFVCILISRAPLESHSIVYITFFCTS